MRIDHDYMRETTSTLGRIDHAAKMLVMELNDSTLEEIRWVIGNTNAAVIRYWRNELRDAMWPETVERS